MDHLDELWEDGQDLGSGVRVKGYGRHGDATDATVGFFVMHHHGDGELCVGGITLDVPKAEGLSGPRWRVLCWKPLHLEPSIFMNPSRGGCGLHGFIRNGCWEAA